MVASTSENSSDRKYGLALNTSVLARMLSRRILRARCRLFAIGDVVDLLRQRVPVALDAIQRQPELRARHRIDRHQRRMRKALVQVLDDDARVVQHQVAVHQRRHRVIRVQVQQVLGQVAALHVDRLDVDALLSQNDPGAVAPGIVGPGEERHHGSALLEADVRRGGLTSRPSRTPFSRNKRTGRTPAGMPVRASQCYAVPAASARRCSRGS